MNYAVDISPTTSTSSLEIQSDTNSVSTTTSIGICPPLRTPSPDHFVTSLESFDKNLQSITSTSAISNLSPIVDQLSTSLAISLSSNSSPTMLPSCISSLPSGHETGIFLSVDLGGSTFRAALVELLGSDQNSSISPPSNTAETASFLPSPKTSSPSSPATSWPNLPCRILYKQSHSVSNETKSLNGLGFFMWMGSIIRQVINYAVDHDILPPNPSLSMGLSWSFPFKQSAVNRGIIQNMGKGYNVTDEIVGWDLHDAFHKAFHQLGLNITLTAIVNDTIASLISHAYQSPSTRLSLILGTGVNSSVIFPIEQIGRNKLIDKTDEWLLGAKSCLVNTEMSMVGTGIIPESCWDVELDAMNELPGYQPLETKVSGRYLGELSRLIIRDLVSSRIICGGVLPKGLDAPYGLLSATMSEIEAFHISGLSDQACKRFLECHPCSQLTPADMAVICGVFEAVSSRSAALVASSLVALANLMPRDQNISTVAFSGTVIERYPQFRQRCQYYLDRLGTPRGRKLTLEPAYEGSFLGPAIASAMYS